MNKSIINIFICLGLCFCIAFLASCGNNTSKINSKNIEIITEKQSETEIQSTSETKIQSTYETESESQTERETMPHYGYGNENRMPFIDENYNIDPNKPMIALTYDDGPGTYTSDLLDICEKYNVHVTFFCLGMKITDKSKEDLKRAVDLGCEIASHTYSHINLEKEDIKTVISEEKKTDKAIFDAIGRYPYFVRPPFGAYNDNVRRKIWAPLVYWSVETKDWSANSSEDIYKKVVNSASDGDIVLMHDIHINTVNAADSIFKTLQDEGYQLVTVSELCYYRKLAVTPGMVIYNCHPGNFLYKNPPERITDSAKTDAEESQESNIENKGETNEKS